MRIPTCGKRRRCASRNCTTSRLILVKDRGFLDLLRDLVADANPTVVANAVAALSEIADEDKGSTMTSWACRPRNSKTARSVKRVHGVGPS